MSSGFSADFLTVLGFNLLGILVGPVVYYPPYLLAVLRVRLEVLLDSRQPSY